KRGESSRNPAAGRSLCDFVKPDLFQSRAKSFVRREKQSPASVARLAACAGKNLPGLPWLSSPIGVESGFSSAGAGALGTVLLFNYSEMTPAQVVGTDLVFGLVLALIGSAVHWSFGSISTAILFQFLTGGIPGVLLGCVLAKRVPAHKLKAVVAVIAICAGLQLVWSGVRSLNSKNVSGTVRLASSACRSVRP